ncbi:peptidoglycan DD-metalloendopeptidase family protein [Vibrio ulleungensis]|uniref:Peptidoglycan DD-metalloendopeptidase family protein n=1 Tax=Vibrio ulleungensis TaxID=2807619 RepID=A0ABS2HRU2_9VIBR|nr:peptidoglycan DD-metalloendopeptidase family protein [Vibrio ulleungensis]MBM7038611.1 peptidoglycan DD-metalloendopeptidase family protein [Vibrio ulleungensis]
MLSIFQRLPLLHRALIAFFTAIVVFALFFLPDAHELHEDDDRLEIGRHYPLTINTQALNPTQRIDPIVALDWQSITVGNGESAAILFQRIGLSARLLHQLVHTNNDIEKQLTRLRPGDTLKFGFDNERKLIQMQRQLSEFETFVITRDSNDNFVSSLDKKEINTRLNYAEASITSSFWNAGIAAGLTANQIMELAGIFGWDIDFALDIREDDAFQVLYEERYVEGEMVGRGKIMAAIFSNQGDTFTAIRDSKTDNFYDDEGRAMKKAFLRSPLDFRRVTSSFNPNRRHPVTGKVTAHRGTDYAAPVGTPIWAAGDGTVLQSGYNQFNGNYVFIKHSNTYITKYLHLKSRKVKKGQRVKQGQTIGTLGGTGRVTGPHLHYEFLVNGVHKNSRTVKLPQSKSLTGDHKTQFLAEASQRLGELERYQHLLIGE